MARGKKYQPEQVVNLLRQIEVAVANGKSTSMPAGRPASWNRSITGGVRSTAVCKWTRRGGSRSLSRKTPS